MDDLDQAIVRELQQNGRITNQELADRVGLTASPCLRRVKQLETAGVITGYTAVVDPRALGMSITAFVRIRLDRHSQDAVDAFESAIRLIENVLECFVVTGESDYLLRIVVTNLEQYERVIRTRLQRLPGITSIDSSFTFGQIKQTFVYPPIAQQGM
ncbi:AsnC family transcriptional regulator [Mycobacterium dioxanotrophicus]|uniref:AsnC family transcriptional regulator n=1 Tax=Mycobacterium dioxanotrophicus TaxID=482462 RepID=A0A1Y0BWK0_9MYCO|nr:Lrp/AsnC family transcriptional regulator [Mycobacterium dioxanotrophicus]ART67280.1 AsnC family transcriptional regulator [Mycobacterium dioxanotrophicus]